MSVLKKHMESLGGPGFKSGRGISGTRILGDL